LQPVLEVPVARTIHKRQRVSVSATCGHLARCTVNIPKVRRQIRDLIERWQPHLAICDREFFLPLAANAAGLKCIGLDNSHLLQVCRYPVPASQFVHWSLSRLEDALFFNHIQHNLIISFFHPELRHGGQNELLPPLLRQPVRERKPSAGNHVLLYQSTATFPALIAVARQLKRPVIVYGFRNEHATDGNLTFKPFDPDRILDDLASCAYAVVNGGHNLICEALYYGKPVLCFPIGGMFEQFLNAWYVRKLGYGDFTTTQSPTLSLFQNFEQQLDAYRQRVVSNFVDGTDQVVQRVDEIINASTR
jgi:uncharacterized protein (TIGR00661 family)